MASLPVAAALLLLAPSALAFLGTAPTSLGTAAAAVEARAHALLGSGDFLGKNPQGWIDWAHAQLGPQDAALPSLPFGEAMRHLYGAAGAVTTPALLAELDARVAAMPSEQADALAGLVELTAQAYLAQRDVAGRLDFAALERMEPALSRADAAASIARAEALRAAADAFRARALALPMERVTDFNDPTGLVVVGGPADNVFTRNMSAQFHDPALLIDLGGDDLDMTSAGGACALTLADIPAQCNGLAVAVRIDLMGDDTYRFVSSAGHTVVAQGAGAFGGLGVLVDFGGNDTYEVDQTVTRRGGLLGTSYVTGVSQGSGEAGVGLLVDLLGDDRYLFNMSVHNNVVNWAQGQGFAGLGGLGALLDAEGDDLYDTLVTCTAIGNWCGLYVQGTGLYPGVAIILDVLGNDRYRGVITAWQEDYYSQAFAAFGALAIQVDGAGDDDYLDSATSRGEYFSVSLNCAFGTAMYAGAVAVFIDGDGDDRYLSETISPNPPMTMSEGFALASAALFWDVRGDDWHEMRAIGPNGMLSGRGTGHSLREQLIPPERQAIYLDTGGRDTYADPVGPGGQNDQVWDLGVDLDLIP